MWIPNQQLKLKMRVKKEKTFRIKTNNQELLIRKQNESDATSWWIEFQKTNLQWKAYRIQDWFTRDFQSYSRLSNNYFFFLGIHLLKMFHSKREVDKIKEKRDERFVSVAEEEIAFWLTSPTSLGSHNIKSWDYRTFQR